MRVHKLQAGETPGTYRVKNPQELLTEQDIFQMAQQLARKRLTKGKALFHPQDVFEHLQVLLQQEPHEVFALLLLDVRHRLIGFEPLFRGTLDGATVYPREVVKVALEQNAAALILVHNHPSGDPTPSEADKALTHTLYQALKPVGITVLDHVVVGREGCVSLVEQGWQPR